MSFDITEDCGVTGVYRSNGRCIEFLDDALFGLSHRGQESYGISTYSDGIETKTYPGIFPEEGMPEDARALEGSFGIGHIRYGTAGSSDLGNAQPIEIGAPFGRFSIAHNGNIYNARELKAHLEGRGFEIKTGTDTELIGYLIAEGDDIIDGYKKAVKRMKGSWCLTVMDKNGIYAMRDSHGFRPLVLGGNDEDYVVSSEPTPFGPLGLSFKRDVMPGEILYIDKSGVHGDSIGAEKPSYCSFCRVYFARQDSIIDTTSVGQVRLHLGANLSELDKTPCDFIQGIPESGNLYAQGYHSRTGEPMGTVIIRNRRFRNFIRPGDRRTKLRSKYYLLPFREWQSGKFFEDSLVRGDTMKIMIEWLRQEGRLREVHLRVGSPPVKRPCPYGIDMQTRDEFAFNKLEGVEGIRIYVNAKTLIYQEPDGFFDGLGISGVPPDFWCTACFGLSDYPTNVPEDFKRF